MKGGFLVITILSLALIAFSCTNNPGYIVLGSPDAANSVGAAIQHVNEAKEVGITIMATPTVAQLLNAVLQVPAVSNSTKSTISTILDLLPELDDWLAEIPGETLQAVDRIMSDVSELETVSAARDYLEDAVASGDYDAQEWLPEALEFGIDLLDAGEDTIYNAGWAPYSNPPLVGFNVTELWRKGLQGAIEGAVGATLADIAPATYAVKIGGVVGAVDSSIADLISQLSGWW